MEPIRFKEANITFAENQEEYLNLPACKTEDGTVVSCWKMGWKERLKVLFTGRVWLLLLTFNHPLQPQLLTVNNPVGKEKK